MPEAQTEEAAETTETPDLGDAGTKAIKAERARADKAEKELKALRLESETRANAELSELERFKKENDELRSSNTAAELQSIRLRVALEKGIPANLASRLQGDDYDSIAADADSLSELVTAKPSGQVRSDPSQGSKAIPASTDPRQLFAAALNEARGK